MAHPKCANSVPSTCGLPSGLVQHFRDSIRRKSSNAAAHRPTDGGHQIEGWVKVPRNGKLSWEQKFCRLENTLLCFYDKENLHSNTPTNELELCPPDGEVIVHSAVCHGELLSTAKSDLPYIFKLEAQPLTTCWPGRTLYMMAPNFAEKQSWVAALESVTNKHLQEMSLMRDAKLFGTPILKLEADNVLDINCTFQLTDEVLLIGAEEGLFVTDPSRCHAKPKMKLDGVGAVFQIGAVKELDCLLLITEDSRELCQLRISAVLGAIQSRSSCGRTLDPFPVGNTQSCHLFATTYGHKASFVCAASSEQITVLKWEVQSKTFLVCKELITAEPCSCIHFTKNTILVGADKFFEVDLNDFKVEEFLDASDSSLAHAVYATARMNSFPIAILHVSPEQEQDEFLLCFNEFAVFVDSFGRRTRKADMKWRRLPLAFAHRIPYLFIAHLNSIEVMEITDLNENRKGKHTFFEMSNPRYLGAAKQSGSVYLASVCENNVEVICLQGNLDALHLLRDDDETDEIETIDSEDVASSNGSEFSFSSVLNVIEPPSSTGSSCT